MNKNSFPMETQGAKMQLEEKILNSKNYIFPNHLLQIQQNYLQSLSAIQSNQSLNQQQIQNQNISDNENNQRTSKDQNEKMNENRFINDKKGEKSQSEQMQESIEYGQMGEQNQNMFNQQKPMDLMDMYIDAKDQVNNWCVAKIIDQDLINLRIIIHFDGWSSKYDESVKITSQRIAPFRKYSKGYSGQKSNAIRDFDLNYSYQVQLLNRIKKIIESDFLCFQDANECTQFIRGELYIYYDSLLTLVTEASEKDIQKIFEFSIEIYKLCLKWIEIFPKYLDMYKQGCMHPNLFAVDLDTAIASCGYELFEMLHKSFGHCERANKFFIMFQKSFKYENEFIDPLQLQNNGLMLSFTAKFAEMGGFERLIDFIQVEKINKDFKCPIGLISMCIRTFQKLRYIGIQNDLYENFTNRILKCIDDRLSSKYLTDSELKDINLDELKYLIKRAAIFFEDFGKKYKYMELYELQIAKKLLMCPYFEKRIKGMNEFKHIQEKVVNRVIRGQKDNKQLNIESALYLDIQTFSNWILENKVIEFIFEENPHSELIKRSSCILYLLVQDLETFPESMIQMIWACCLPEKHEDIVRNTFELITELVKCLPSQRLELLFVKIQSLGLQIIDDKTIFFLKDYTINAIENLKIKKKQEMLSKGKNQNNISQYFQRGQSSQNQKRASVVSSQSQNKNQNTEIEDSRYYNPKIFWDILQDQNQYANNKTKELSLQCLIEILKIDQTYRPNIKEQFVNMALENIQNGSTVFLSIQFLQELLNTYSQDDQHMSSGFNTISSNSSRSKQSQKNQQQVQEISIENLIGQILKKSDIFQNVITQAAAYMKQFQINQLNQTLQTQQISQENISETQKIQVKQEKSLQHEDKIKTFINFIEFIIINSRIATLQLQHVQKMFQIFVTEAQTEIETREFFIFLTKQNQNAKSRDRLYLLDEKLRFQVFTKIMCNEESMNCQNLNIQAFECFHQLFLGVNIQAGGLKEDKDGAIIHVTNFGDLQGINTMWKIAIYCHDNEVKSICRNKLVDLFQMNQSKLQNQKQKMSMTDIFVKQCYLQMQTAYEQLKQNQNSEKIKKELISVIVNCLNLVKVFIIRFDKEHILHDLRADFEQMSVQDQKQIRTLRVNLDPDCIQIEVDVNINCKFWELMKICGQIFGMKMSEFFILAKSGPIPSYMYNDKMKEYDLKEIQLQRILPEKLEKELPSYLIGYQQDFVNLLISFLQIHDDEITHEVLILFDKLQVGQEIKKAMSNQIMKLQQLQISDIQDSNLNMENDWKKILKWESNKDIYRTYYMLICLREIMVGKQQYNQNSSQIKYTVIKSQQSSSQQAQQQQEKQLRLEIQQQVLTKGGFHFLMYMFKSIEKQIDFEKDILSSKIIQMLIVLLDILHAQKHVQIISQYEKPQHVKDLLIGCLIIIKSFLNQALNKQNLKILQIQQKNASNKFQDNKSQNLNKIRNSMYLEISQMSIDTTILTTTVNFFSKILFMYPQFFNIIQKDKISNHINQNNGNNEQGEINSLQEISLEDILKISLIDIASTKIQERILKICKSLFTKIEQKIIELSTQEQEGVNIDNQNAQISVQQNQQQLQKTLSKEVMLQLPSHVILKVLVNDFVQMSLNEPFTIKMQPLYHLISQILSETQVNQTLDQIQAPELLVKSLISKIFEREIKESNSRDLDYVLQGLFDFLGQVLILFPSVRQNLAEKIKLIEYLTHNGLFKKEKRIIYQISNEINHVEKNLHPLCKNTSTRNSCLELLRILCMDDLQDKLYFTQYLGKNVCNETFWRTPRKQDWSVQVVQQEKSITGYVGLKNPGCICYMNSIFQQLYMIPMFRKTILEVEDKNQEDQQQDQNVLFQVKCIFAGLMEGEKQYFNPKKFIKSFKDIDGSPLDPFVQKDVDEFFNLFMDRIESLVKGTKAEKIIQNLFQGVFANEFICKDCPHYSEREEAFLAISLQVKNKKSVQDSLKFYVEGEMLEGDNAYYCEKCEKKVSTLKRCCIKRMPNIMFLVLKRFEFDFDTMQKIKVNDFCEFPLELDMSPYSQQELTRQDLIKKMEEKNLQQDDLNEEEMHILKRRVPEGYYKYNLKGIVVHYGTADQGHYYSFIQDRENKNSGWFEFNDVLVRDFDPSEIPEETFGGDDNNLANNITEMQAQNNGQVDQAMILAMRQFKTKIKNAYVLIYDRQEFYEMQKINDLMDDTKSVALSNKEYLKLQQACKIQSISSSQSQQPLYQIPINVHDTILAKNKKFWLSKSIFSVDFIKQMHLIFKDIKIKEDQNYQKYSNPQFDLQKQSTGDQFEAFKFIITFFLTVALRSKERTVLPDYLELIREALKKNIGLCLWLLETFTNQDFIKEFLIDCPIHDMCRFTQGLLKTSMQQVYELEKQKIDLYLKQINQPDGVLNYIRNTQQELIEEECLINAQNENGETKILSNCSELNLFKLKGHNEKLPKLIIFINSYIHFSTSQYFLNRYYMSGQFWQIFTNFSLLGESARNYLLQAKSLGRMIDIFLNLKKDNFFSKQILDDYQFKFRDFSLRKNVPLFEFSKDFYIEIDPERSLVQMSQTEKKQIQTTLSPPQTFLVHAITNLARSCSLVKFNAENIVQAQPPLRYNFALDSLNVLPDKEEIELLQTHDHYRWWNPGYSKLTRNQISLMFAHMCTYNNQFTLQYINKLIQMVTQQETYLIRQYERPLLRVIQVADKMQVERIKRIQIKLFEHFKNSLQYFMQADAITEIVLKLCLRSPPFSQCLSNSQIDFFNIMEKFWKENHTLPVCSPKLKVFKEGQTRWNDMKPQFLNKQKLDWISTYTRQRMARLVGHLRRSQKEQIAIANKCAANDVHLLESSKKLSIQQSIDNLDLLSTNRSSSSNLTANQQDELFDSDDDMYNRKLQIDQEIDFCHNNVWYLGKVDIALDEMIKCVAVHFQNQQVSAQFNFKFFKQSQGTKIQHWIELESDSIAAANSVTGNEREHFHRFIVELSQFIVRNQQHGK